MAKRRILTIHRWRALLYLFVWTAILPLNAQWARTYGGWNDDKAYFIQPTKDGGCIISGYSASFGKPGYLLLKLSSSGKIEWQKVFLEYGGPAGYGFDLAYRGQSIYPTKDGGYILAAGAYVLKLTANGGIEWQRLYRNNYGSSERALIVRQTPDDGYIIAGYTDFYFSTSILTATARVVKLTARGDVEWSAKYYGADIPTTLTLTDDGGYLLCGYNIGKDASSSHDPWIMKLDSRGAFVRLQGLHFWDDYSDPAIDKTADGGFIFTAGAHMIKFNPAGNIEWHNKISQGSLKFVQQTRGGRYIAAGSIDPTASGKKDLFVLRTDSAGALEWGKIYGGTGNDIAYGIMETSDGKYLVAGSTESFGAGAADVLILRINENGGIASSCPPGKDADVTLTHVDDTIVYFSPNLDGNPLDLVPEDTQVSLRDSNLCSNVLCGSSPPIIYLSPNQLYFGAQAGLTTASPQHFNLLNSGSGPFKWSIESIPDWLSCSPSSGTGSARVAVSLDPSALAAGETSAILMISSAEAENSPQPMSVHVKIYETGSNVAPFGSFDTPIDGTSGIAGAIPVTGWALDDQEVTKVEIWRDNVTGEAPGQWFIGDGIFVAGARPDVEQACPGYPLNYRAGWGYMLLTNMLPNHGNGTYKLYAFVTDKEGNRVLLGTKTITCSNATAVRPFGTIDSPTQGGDASGSAYACFGWVLTPLPKTVPKDGSTIDVYVDSVKVGTLATAPNVYNQYRVDVTTAFPGLNNSGGPVGAFYLDTTKYVNGVHTIYWIATDDAGAADGIGSRYFNIFNTGTPAQAGSESINQGKADLYESVMSLPVSFEPRRVRRGFRLKTEPEVLQPDNYGTLHIEIKEVERVEIDLGKAKSIKGYQIVGEELRSLPIGSTLDQTNGTFSWMPGPGFLGTYDLLFLQTDGFGITRRIPVKVMIRPKFEK